MKTRRGFLLTGAAATASSAALSAAPSRFASRVKLLMDGRTYFDFVRWNPFLNPAPDFSALPPNPEIRVRWLFPYGGRDVFETYVYLRLSENLAAPVSHFLTEVQDVQLSEAALPGDRRTIAFYGKVLSSLLPSPFGHIAGKPAVFSGSFDKLGPPTRFEFFGGPVAGSHATFVPEAYGSLEIETPLGSF